MVTKEHNRQVTSPLEYRHHYNILLSKPSTNVSINYVDRSLLSIERYDRRMINWDCLNTARNLNWNA